MPGDARGDRHPRGRRATASRRAGPRRRLVVALWIATLLVAAPSLLYYANGGSQFGMRHALDFEPFLLVLMALAVREGVGWIWPAAQGAIAWSVAVGLWGCWVWDGMRAKLGL